MKKTGIIYSRRFLLHKTGEGHPESPRRLRAIMHGIKTSRLLDDERFILIEPQSATLETLQLVHPPEFINRIREFCRRGGGIFEEETETVLSLESFEVARLAAGGALKAVEMVMNGKIKNAFVASRPPGHHASSTHTFGFCVFNNIALAAKYLVENFSLSRILILDIDSHSGDGTQSIFYDTDKILYIGLHEDPSEFPRAGFLDEVGEDEGLGYTVNIPLPFGTTDSAYWKAMKSIVMPIAMQYKPEFILISAGFDGYFRDLIGNLYLSAYIFLRIFQVMLNFAHLFSRDRIVAILEGGYRSNFLRRIVPAIIARMAGIDAEIRDDRPFFNVEAQKKAEKVIEEVKEMHSRFWKL